MSEVGSVPPPRLGLTVGSAPSSDCNPRPSPLVGAAMIASPLRRRRHLSPRSHFTGLLRSVVGVIAGAVVTEAVREVILAQIGELRRTAVGIVDGVDAADHIVPMVGSAAGAAVA